MNWLGVVLLGGIAGVDATSVAQTMISRPFIVATLTGLLVGRPEEGLILGAILELFALVILPVGAARYPEAGTAAVAATAGVAFLVLIALYLPALLILHIRGEDLFDRTPRATPPITRDAWLQTHGLAVTMPTYVTRFAAVLAPLLAAGPFSALLRIVLGI